MLNVPNSLTNQFTTYLKNGSSTYPESNEVFNFTTISFKIG